MQALYHVIEYGHRTVFLNQYADGTDIFYLLSSAVPAAGVNGGNLTAALAGVDNSSGFYKELPPARRPLVRLNSEEAVEYDRGFQTDQGAGQRVTVDLDQGVMRFEHGRNARTTTPFQDGAYPVPPTVTEPLKQAREASVVRLKDLVLLGLPPAGVYLVHGQCDVGFIPAAGLRDLSGKGKAEFADLLNTKVDAIQSGAYGVELVMTGIGAERLEDFDRARVAMLQAGSPLGLFQPESSGAAMKQNVPAREAVRAVKDYLCFERDTTQIWPWSLSAEEMLSDRSRLREIGAALHHDPQHGYDLEEIHQALNEAFGVNPSLERGQGQTM